MDDPLVSVIIPCYRQAEYLPDAIDSALAQTYPRIEVVVINDGSDDNTDEVAKSYGDRITYVRRENGGLGAARNTGFAASRGQFIQFLDADDVIAVEKITRQMACLRSRPDVGVCICKYSKTVGETGVSEHSLLRTKLRGDPLMDMLSSWQTEMSIPIHAALFARRLWKDRPPFREHLRAREDWALWIDILLAGTRMHHLEEDLATYRTHGTGMTQDPVTMVVSMIEVVAEVVPLIPQEYRKPFIEHAASIAENDVNGAIDVRDARLNEVYRSLSWRLTRPMRWLRGKLTRP